MRPLTTAPVCTDIDVNAMIVPLKAEAVPNVAEVPTCQKTLHAWAPLITLTLLAEAVVRAEAVWKMKTASGSFWPSSVRVPLSWRSLAGRVDAGGQRLADQIPGNVGGRRTKAGGVVGDRQVRLCLQGRRVAGVRGAAHDSRRKPGDRGAGVHPEIPAQGAGAGVGDRLTAQHRVGRGSAEVWGYRVGGICRELHRQRAHQQQDAHPRDEYYDGGSS